jgi:hypothetical protein
MDAVSAALVERRVAVSERDRAMLGWSMMAHVTALALVAIGPATWIASRPERTLSRVITLDIADAIGAYNGGLTSAAARPVQQPRGLPEEPVRPIRTAASAGSRALMPAAREETRRGGVVAQAGPQTDAIGLTTGRVAGRGAYVGVADFCCPEYIATLQELINRHWTSSQEAAGVTVMKFTIERDGRLTQIERERSSGILALDLVSERALVLTKQLPPLPAAYAQPTLTVHLTFEYSR